MAYHLLSLFLALVYAALLLAYRRGWRAIPERQIPPDFVPKSRITVLIPARNEAKKIGACLRSILEGNYPWALLELIVLDDFSEDGTAGVVNGLSESFVFCLQLSNQLPPEARFTANKKKALELGISKSNGELIVTTDADCIVPKDWLLYIAAAFENREIQMVCAPVNFHLERNLLQRFQSLDFLGLMGITGAGMQLGWHYMANGANLAYRKQAFEAVKGYTGNEHLASGDDMFLVQKMVNRWPDSIAFIKSLAASVQTEAMPDLDAFWRQRLRWGTKNAAMPDWPLRLSLLTVFIFCWSIWLNLAQTSFAFFMGMPTPYSWILVFQIVFKATFDYLFLSEMARFFKREDLMSSFLPSFVLHTIYIPTLGAASLLTKKFKWKGRSAQ